MTAKGLSRLKAASDFLDAIAVFFGRIGAILIYLLLAAVIVHVAMRYFFGLNMIRMEELHWHLAAAAFLLSLAYANVEGAHVRVDLIYDTLGFRGKAWVNLLGSLFLLLPFGAFMAYFAADYFWSSWLVGESSEQPGALPARYVLKFVLLLGLVLLLTQAVSVLLRALRTLLSNVDEAGQTPAAVKDEW